MKPLRGLMGYALRHRQIAVNPFDLLTADDRPTTTRSGSSTSGQTKRSPTFWRRPSN
jgi:hypothetical protein